MKPVKQVTVTVCDIDDLLTEETSEPRTTCKFMLVKSDDEVIFLFGRLSRFPYHASLLAWFAQSRKLAGFWEHKPDLYEIVDSNYEPSGGGYVIFDWKRSKAEFSGASTAYGKFDPNLLKEVLASSRLSSTITSYSVRS